MGSRPRGIGRGNAWPCVGDPSTWDTSEWNNCGALGSLSLLAAVQASELHQDVRPQDDGPVLVHVTVCPAHVRPVRRWLQAKTLEPVDTYGTEVVMREWGQIEHTMGEDVPVLRMVPEAV